MSKDNRHGGIFPAQRHEDLNAVQRDRIECVYPNRETAIIGQGLEYRFKLCDLHFGARGKLSDAFE